MTTLTKERLFAAVENGFYIISEKWDDSKRGFVPCINKVKVGVIKLNHSDHTRVVLSTVFRGRAGYREFDPEKYGVTWALTKGELHI